MQTLLTPDLRLLTTVLLSFRVFWHVTPCRWVCNFLRFEKPQLLQLYDPAAQENNENEHYDDEMNVLWPFEVHRDTSVGIAPRH
jgi:hypothetical protein